jgi:secretion/DNA translocation related TadE-like protein
VKPGVGRFDDAEGSMSVMTAFAVAAVLAVTVAVLLVGRAAVAVHSARSAADLAALAGAHALRAGEDACSAASGVATANRAVAAGCTVDGHDVVIRAEVRVELGILGARAASAVARAGPL